MGLSFINGGFLGALSLIGIPIIIHLLQRRRFRVLKWGAMEFLRLSQRNRSRRLWLEQLLLLLIRCLVIALVVLAVCRPIVRLGGLPIATARGQVHAIIILDNSYSMGYRPTAAGETLFDRALKRALELVEHGLRQGDGVSVVLASDPTRALIRKPSLDLKAVAVLLQRLRLSDFGTNYGKAARLVLGIIEESQFANREVYLISDNQAAGWEGPARDTAAWEAVAGVSRLVFLPVREGPAPNAAVEWVQAARGISTARSSTRIQARVVNYGTQPVRNLLVTLEVDGKTQGASERVDIEPQQGVLVAFNQLFDKPGVRACAVRIATDRLPADDLGYLALRVRQSVRVLVLNGSPNASLPQHDAGFFLQLALSPPLSGPGAEPTPIEPQVVNGSRFGSANVRQFDVVALSNVSALEPGDRRLLAEFVQNGGGVLVFLGNQVNASLYNRDLFDAQPRLLPARLGSIVGDKTSLDPATLNHPALQRFRGAQDVEIGTAEFTRYFTLETRADDKSVQVAARFANGQPAIVERPFGLGKVVLVATTATTEWNNLPLKPAFLPLMHQLAAYLAAGSEGTRNGRVGEPMVKPLPLAEANSRVSITDPAGAVQTLKPAVDERGAVVTLEAPSTAGFYRMEVPNGTKDVFAVNRDTAESDLRALDQPALRRLIATGDWVWVRPEEDLLSALVRSRQGIELWRHLLLTALLLMIVETALAQVFGRRA